MHRMRKIRHKEAWTQQKLAVEAKVSPSTISMIERYGYVPGGGMRRRLAKALGVKPRDIWPDVEDSDDDD